MEYSRVEVSDDEIRTHLRTAVLTTLHNDRDLLLLQSQEQSIAHRVAVYLEPFFKGYHVDCEYNRLRDEIKRYYSTKRKRYAGFRPDILIHVRNQKVNLLAVEIKANGRSDEHLEIEKLKAVVKDESYAYRIAAYVRIHNGSEELSSEVMRASIKWYSRSEPDVNHEVIRMNQLAKNNV